MKKQRPSKAYIRLLRLRGCFVAVFCAFLCGGIAVFNSITGYILLTVTITVLILFIFWYAPAICETSVFYTSNKCLIIEKGIFIKRKCITPLKKITYTKSLTSPCERLYKLFDIAICTNAGTTAYICGLSEMPSFAKEIVNEQSRNNL